MLTKIVINNFAIIDHLEIDFGPGLNIFTGETGAGKSIIMGALGLILGERIYSGMLRKGARSGYVEGYFKLKQSSKNEKLTLRREMTASGGSKYLINGETLTISSAREKFENIIDLHGQHQHQSLLDPGKYYGFLDNFGKLTGLAEDVRVSYRMIISLRNKLTKLEKKAVKIEEMRDYLEYQLKEIIELAPGPGEDEELEREARLLQNASQISHKTKESSRLLYDDSNSAASNIRKTLDLITDLNDILPELTQFKEDLQGALVSVEETALYLQKNGDRIESDPAKLEMINLRLASLKQIKRKYKTDLAGVLEKKREIEEELTGSEDTGQSIKKLSKEIDKEIQKFGKMCLELSKKRHESAKILQEGIKDRLNFLGMDKSIFEVFVDANDPEDSGSSNIVFEKSGKKFSANEYGIDSIDFLIATGKEERILSVSRVASGGEVSRIMLAIKSVLMKADNIPVLVFDEIDTGISGRIATAVGKELLNLASCHQLLCITHLPQIASMSQVHFCVEKQEIAGRVVTRVRKLGEKDKVCEIAKLLAGEKVTDVHIQNAKELIQTSGNQIDFFGE